MSSNSQVGTTSESTINSLLFNASSSQAETNANMRIRRALIMRNKQAYTGNGTGTILPHPFDESSVAIRQMLGEMATAVQTATERITGNPPDIAVIPLSTTSDINATVSKMAGMQERLDAELWHECGGLDAQWEAGWAKSVGAAAFWLSLPRDADFGLPDRDTFESDDEIDVLKNDGKYAPTPKGSNAFGKLIYAEHGDVWAKRRQEYMKNRAVGSMSGRSLFTLQVYPRDMVLKERDKEAKDLKWAAIVEEISASECAPGSDFASNIASAKGLENVGLYGIFYDKDQKKIIGGIPKGGPLGYETSAYQAYTLIRWFDRKEQVILIAPKGSVQGATEIWRGEHGCVVQGVPSCPVVEDPFYRTDINVTGQEYSTALDEVFAYVPAINQLMTILSNVATFNGIPRWVGELSAGSTLRGDSGEPGAADSAPVPGLSPDEMSFWPGKISQMTIDAATLLEALKIYFERLALVMPQRGAAESGADAAGWAILQRVQEGQEPYKRPVQNFCQAVSGIVQRWHGWLRQLDTSVYFFAAPDHRKNDRELRGLIEFDPKNLTDSIKVTQDIYTQSEQTIRSQVQMEKWQAQLIDDEEFYETTGEQDARAAVIRRWVQILVNYVMTGTLPPPPPGVQQSALSIVQIVGDGVRGEVHYELLQTDPNYQIAVAENMVAQSQAMGAQGGQQPMPDGQGNPANAQGARAPGVGMNPTLQGQTGLPTGTPA